MIIQFKNSYLEALFQGKAVAGKPRFSIEVISKFKKTILKLKNADNIREIRSQKSLNFEALKGNYKGFHSVRVDRSYRVILSVDSAGQVNVADILTVHDLTNH